MKDTNTGMVIYPTGTCFEDATQFLFARVMEDRKRLLTDEYILVHAIVWPSNEKKKFSHAWVEHEGHVITWGIVNGGKIEMIIDKKEYYEKMNVLEFDRYTLEQGYEAEKKVGHPPPWKRKYAKLCKGARR